ncbi:NfeD family protein [Hyphococcus formosus]|uniref:NfeD family protein n=1 Tax=Hyphococcus formosus TaxID=3143534 RepID=UPI00398B0EBC
METIYMPSNPAVFIGVTFLIGFALVAIAKVYGLFFMGWKTPFRLGDEMNVDHAEVVGWENGKGFVSAGGELWSANSADDLAPGDAVTVTSVNGLKLQVKKKPA